MGEQKACEILPLSVLDLAKGHRGAIQGQRRLLQHSHSGTIFRRCIFYRSRGKGQGRHTRSQGNIIMTSMQETVTCVFVFPTHSHAIADTSQYLSLASVCERCLTVVRYLEGVLAFSFLSPAAHSGESPVLVVCRVSVCTKTLLH